MPPPALVCPETKLGLELLPLQQAADRLGGRPTGRRTGSPEALGATDTVLLRADGGCAYPVVDGIPMLLVPEQLSGPAAGREFDLADARYAEAYEEMPHYNAVAEHRARLVADGSLAELRCDSAALTALDRLARHPAARRTSFPEPRELWISAHFDTEAEYDAYRHLAPLAGKRALQVGGSGIAAIAFLLAGASEATLLTPMLGELRLARALARHYEVADRLAVVGGVAEELPFPDGRFDVIYAGGCVHHMVTAVALPECARALADGGRFAAVEPWRAPGYRLGTSICGKRERDVHCRPLTADRTRPLYTAFSSARIVHHGTFTRYPLIALGKLGLRVATATAARIQRADDVVASRLPRARRAGSSVALLAAR